MEDSPKIEESSDDGGVDLGDGFGPFFLPKAVDYGEQLEFLIKTKAPESFGYADSVAHKATEEFNDLRKGTQVYVNLRREEQELKGRIKKAYTKSRNPKVRERFKEIRDRLEAQLIKVQDELKGMEIQS